MNRTGARKDALLTPVEHCAWEEVMLYEQKAEEEE
jgi:hypothetical protein